MRSVLIVVAALIVGIAVGRWVLPGGGGVATAPTAEAEQGGDRATADRAVRWRMGSAFPGAMAQIGTLGKRLESQISEVSGGNFQIRFFEPGALVPALDLFDAVSTGSVDAGWSTPGYWAGKVPALQFFSAVPFGPPAGEYMAWIFYGGGQELFEELYARHNIKALFCGIIAPEASGWFRRPIERPEDLQGLKMRFFGLGAKVMEKLGVSTQLLAGGDIYPALELGTIDALEYSMPAIDLDLGFHQIAKHYYFPGWHQQSTLFELMINMDRWNALSDVQKAQLRSVCGDQFRQSIAEGEYIQVGALEELQQRGVQIHVWPDEMLQLMADAWDEVVAEEAARDPDFARVWDSLRSFRESYRIWGELGYLRWPPTPEG